jgi:hypothetical protein
VLSDTHLPGFSVAPGPMSGCTTSVGVAGPGG